LLMNGHMCHPPSQHEQQTKKERTRPLARITQTQTLAPSKRMSVCLHEIAREFPSLKVCEIVSTDAIPGFDEIALPALIVYKAKEVYTTFMRVTDEIGFAFEAADVISVLVKAEVVSE